jgi:Domain of unknown function (DUF4282)
MTQEKGFFGSLFDFSFSDFITIKIIKFLYMLGMIIAALAAIGVIVAGFGKSIMAGIGALIISPVIFLLYIIMFRVWLEIIIVVFRIADNTGKMADRTG